MTRATTGRRDLMLGGALVAAAAATWALQPRRAALSLDRDVLDRAIPSRIGDYGVTGTSGLILPPADELTQRLYDQVLTRVYRAHTGPPVMLLVAYGSADDGALSLHRPESCYAAAGFEVARSRAVPLPGIPVAGDAASFCAASLDGHTEQILSWTRVGRAFPPTTREERWAIVRANLTGTMPDSILVRLSTVRADAAAALAALSAFNARLVGGIGPIGARILLGVGA